MKNQRLLNFASCSRYIWRRKTHTENSTRCFPILISHAQNGSIITMWNIAKEVVPHLTQFNWTMAWAFCWIHNTLYELERRDDWNYGEIPGLTAIVLDEPRKPTNWMDKHTRMDPNTPLSWAEYEKNHIQPVFEYPHWDKVLDFVKDTLTLLDRGDAKLSHS